MQFLCNTQRTLHKLLYFAPHFLEPVRTWVFICQKAKRDGRLGREDNQQASERKILPGEAITNALGKGGLNLFRKKTMSTG